MIARLLNSAWQLSCQPAASRFRRAIENPGKAQDNLLFAMLARNQQTKFGRHYGFRTIESRFDFRDRVPLQSYDSLRQMIETVAGGEPAVLTRQRPTRLLPSSGSSAARKLIPYTRDFQRQLDHAISPWIHNLMAHRPRIKSGRAFWSVSPRIDSTACNDYSIPTGFDDDSAYLSKWSKPIARRLLASPPDLARIPDIEEFRYQQLLHLLACGDLSLVSIWHPSYLTLLLNELPNQWCSLMRDLRRLDIDRDRLAYLQRAGFESCEKIWPGLELISCWGGGHAAGALGELKKWFPTTEFQEKGLIATEAVVSIPYFDGCEKSAPKVLAIESHFLEFLSDDDDSKFADELTEGETYRVVVTTASGLYRYQLQDRVVVTGKLRRTPTIEFLGKEDSISDYCGEKLSDSFVARQLGQLLAQQGIESTFAMLAPDRQGKGVSYTLYLEASGRLNHLLAEKLDDSLRENPHYRLCRELGQLSPIRIFSISGASNESFIRRRMLQGHGLGDIKPVSLSNQAGWSECFEGSYLA